MTRTEVFSTWGRGKPVKSAPDPLLEAVKKQTAIEIDRETDEDLFEALSNLYETAIEIETPSKTSDIYVEDFKSFTSWCRSAGASPLPCGPGTFALFLHGGAKEGVSHKRLLRVTMAVADAHSAFGYANPTDNPLTWAIIRSTKTQTKVCGKATKPERKIGNDN